MQSGLGVGGFLCGFTPKKTLLLYSTLYSVSELCPDDSCITASNITLQLCDLTWHSVCKFVVKTQSLTNSIVL